MISCFSCVELFATLWAAIARQAPLSMGLSRQEYWCGLPCPPQGDLPDTVIETRITYVPCIGRWVLYHLGSPYPHVASAFSYWIFTFYLTLLLFPSWPFNKRHRSWRFRHFCKLCWYFIGLTCLLKVLIRYLCLQTSGVRRRRDGKGINPQKASGWASAEDSWILLKPSKRLAWRTEKDVGRYPDFVSSVTVGNQSELGSDTVLGLFFFF